MKPVNYTITINFEPLDNPENWTAISVLPGDRYYYRNGIRGMFATDDKTAQDAFLATAIPTALMVARTEAEREAAEQAEIDRQEREQGAAAAAAGDES